jgi:uncharacterized membrane protein
MEMMGVMAELFRWLHVIAAFVWVGVGFFFAFVFLRFSASADVDLRKKLMTGIVPQSAYLMRWAALWTWVMGFMLMGMVFYHGGTLFEDGYGWSAASILTLIVVYVVSFAIYEGLARSPLAGKPFLFAIVSLVFIVAIAHLMMDVAGFSYRGYVIHIGAMFGTIMTANVWMSIWPAQREALKAFKDGQPPDAVRLGRAMERGKHNTYMSIPVFYTMLNMHTAMTVAALSPVFLLGAIILGWLIVALLYKLVARAQ